MRELYNSIIQFVYCYYSNVLRTSILVKILNITSRSFHFLSNCVFSLFFFLKKKRKVIFQLKNIAWHRKRTIKCFKKVKFHVLLTRMLNFVIRKKNWFLLNTIYFSQSHKIIHDVEVALHFLRKKNIYIYIYILTLCYRVISY